jgi:hypothetical protein
MDAACEDNRNEDGPSHAGSFKEADVQDGSLGDDINPGSEDRGGRDAGEGEVRSRSASRDSPGRTSMPAPEEVKKRHAAPMQYEANPRKRRNIITQQQQVIQRALQTLQARANCSVLALTVSEENDLFIHSTPDLCALHSPSPFSFQDAVLGVLQHSRGTARMYQAAVGVSARVLTGQSSH